MKRAEFSDLVTCLNGDQPPRVWSLLVTVFGELAQQDGARISGALLRYLSDLIGYKPEAVRVALHRLRKDGWIDSQKHGRTSDYALTKWGRAQSAAASPRIYATEALATRAWMEVHEPGGPTPKSGPETVSITPALLLTSQPTTKPTVFVTELSASNPLPSWIRQKLCDVGTAALARDLCRALDQMQRHGMVPASLGPCERAVLRVLIVHGWRRIVLKTPILPDFVFADDWAGATCRQQVAAILREIPKPDLGELESSLARRSDVLCQKQA